MIHLPNNLTTGDTVTIVAPAGKIQKEKVENAILHFESWGLKVKLGRNIYNNFHYFSAKDQERIQDFQDALDDSESKAIICARGGYGSIRIIDHLDFTSLIENPKWVVGFSDITIFHVHVYKKFKLPSIHGMMPIQFPKFPITNKALLSLKDALFGRRLTYNIASSAFNRIGKCRGILVGGNLSILYSLLGSLSESDFAGKILFMEDVGEYHYHLDRMLVSLKRKGVFEEIAGLIIGAFNEMKDGETFFGFSAFELISDAVKTYNFPLCFNMPMGHIKDNNSLIIGVDTSMDVNKEYTVIKNHFH